ncbi:hypothetical protein [Nonomuraea sp. bgisy101]|uniref:hypothetical protein n=1 Tax=Nonomuraea sp. bgisy101 TaxID=3413784 RepID=UPI003D74C1F1
MSSHLRHVRRLLDERRFPWAHAYVDRLISDSPLDPEPWLLRALILDRQGRPNGEAVRRAEELGGDYTTLRNSVPVPSDARRPWWDGWAVEIVAALLLGGLVAPLVWQGERLAAIGPGDWFVVVYVAGLLAVRGGLWALTIRRREGLSNIPAAVRARRDASRAFYAGLDDAGLRHHVGGSARFLWTVALVGTLAYGLLPIEDQAVALRSGAVIAFVAVTAGAWQVMGAAPVRRALRVSWVVSLNAALGVIWLAVTLAAPGWDAAPYLLVWGLAGWLPLLIARITARLS